MEHPGTLEWVLVGSQDTVVGLVFQAGVDLAATAVPPVSLAHLVTPGFQVGLASVATQELAAIQVHLAIPAYQDLVAPPDSLATVEYRVSADSLATLEFLDSRVLAVTRARRGSAVTVVCPVTQV